MASGKSLELTPIMRAPAQSLCICGETWDSHMRKDSKGLLRKFLNEDHRPRTNPPIPGSNRAQRRAMKRVARRG